MEVAHRYLVSKGKSQSDIGKFKRQLYDLWFKPYRRTRGSRALDSSGFEHVFVGETRNKSEILGFHNWIQFYLQEKAGNVDYQGYILGKKVCKWILRGVVVVETHPTMNALCCGVVVYCCYGCPCSQSLGTRLICLLLSSSGIER